MALSFFIANRFTGSGKKSRFLSLISIISVLGIAIGVATLILALTVINGFEKTIAEKLIQLNSHIQITTFSNKTLPDYKIIRPVLTRRLQPYATGVSPFVAGLAIIKHKQNTDGVTLKGILPEYDISNIRGYVVEGKFNISTPDSLPPVLLGKKLAERLFVKTGSKVTVFTIKNDALKNNALPTPENPPAIKQFRVAGIFESGMAEYDDQYAYINLHTAQEIFGMENHVNGYDIKLNDLSKADSLAENIMGYFGYPYYARTIFKTYQSIFTWVDLQKRLVPISLVLIVIVAVFNIVGTLLMIVLERSNAIGTLKSMGATGRQIISIFVLQGIYLSIIGIAAGNLLALVISILQKKFNLITLPESVYFMSQAPIAIQWQDYLIVSSATFLLCIMAAFIPSFIASRINTLSTLRFQ